LEFRIGLVLSRTWDLLWRRAPTFLLLVGSVGLVTLLIRAYAHLDRGMMFFVDYFIAVALSGVAQAFVVLAAFQEMRGGTVNPRDAVVLAMSRIGPVFLLSWIHNLGITIGLLLCIAPGVFVMAVTAVAFPACVVERLGPIKSIARSLTLTQGRRSPIAGVVGAWWAIYIGALIMTIQGFPVTQLGVRRIVLWLWTTPMSTYLSVMTAVLYHDLRSEREGIGIKEIAAIFD
jgi:hypothetical protein